MTITRSEANQAHGAPGAEQTETTEGRVPEITPAGLPPKESLVVAPTQESFWRRHGRIIGTAGVVVVATGGIFAASRMSVPGGDSQENGGSVAAGPAFPGANPEKTASVSPSVQATDIPAHPQGGEAVGPSAGVERDPLLNDAANERLSLLTPDAIAKMSTAELGELAKISPELYDGTLEGYGRVTGKMLAAILSGVMSSEFRNNFYAKGGKLSKNPDTGRTFLADAMLAKLGPLLENLFDVDKSDGGSLKGMLGKLDPLMLRVFLLGNRQTPEGQAYELVFDGLTVTVNGDSLVLSLKVRDSADMWEDYTRLTYSRYEKRDAGISGKDPMDPNLYESQATFTLVGVTGLSTTPRAREIQTRLG